MYSGSVAEMRRRREMKTNQSPWLVSQLLIFIFLMLLPSAAEASSLCRCNSGGSTSEALGEEFPEWVAGLTAFTLGLYFPNLLPVCADALGEEFPEILSGSNAAALGEEFPERSDRKDNDALGEEFPE